MVIEGSYGCDQPVSHFQALSFSKTKNLRISLEAVDKEINSKACGLTQKTPLKLVIYS